MSFTREEWSRDFLLALGNAAPDQATIDWVVGWTVHETSTDTGALFNLLNTTQHAPGSTDFNNVGVQNYTSYQQGTQTNAEVLHQNFAGYSQLAHALITNDAAALAGPDGAVQQGLNTWCGGCGYGAGFESLGQQHRDDTFTYGGAPVAIPTGPFYTVVTGQNGVPVEGNAIAAAMGLSWADIVAIPGQPSDIGNYDPTGPYLVDYHLLLPGFPPPAAPAGTAKLVIDSDSIRAVVV